MRNQLVRVACVLVLTTACSSEPGTPQDQTAEAAKTTKAGAAAPRKPAAASNAPAAARAPRFREITIPAGTPLSLTLDTAVASDTSKVEDAVSAKLAAPVVVGGVTALPAGTEATGSVFEAEQSGRVKGLAKVSFGFDHLRAGKESYTISAARISKEAEPTKAKDAEKVGIGAGVGAIVGALAGGKKGAAIGTAVGAGAGAGTVLATRGEEVTFPAGTAVETTLEKPLTIQVPIE